MADRDTDVDRLQAVRGGGIETSGLFDHALLAMQENSLVRGSLALYE